VLFAIITGGCKHRQAKTTDDSVSQTVFSEQTVDTSDVYTQLIKAIEIDDQNSFDELIKQIADIDSFIPIENDFSYTLLGYACKYKRCGLAGKLIGLGADIEIGCTEGYIEHDALFVAIEDLCLVKLLLDNGADPNRLNSEEGLAVLSLSCRENNYDISKLLIERGAKVDGWGYTEGLDYVHYPLLYAVESNNIKLVQLLIENNCKIDISDRQGETPFTIAERHNNRQMYDLLTKNLMLQQYE
jgi:ankyrin repeat protein